MVADVWEWEMENINNTARCCVVCNIPLLNKMGPKSIILCKKCRHKKWHQENKDARSLYQRQWREENKDYYKQYNREQLLKACHHTNLQPLWARDNIIKGARM